MTTPLSQPLHLATRGRRHSSRLSLRPRLPTVAQPAPVPAQEEPAAALAPAAEVETPEVTAPAAEDQPTPPSRVADSAASDATVKGEDPAAPAPTTDEELRGAPAADEVPPATPGRTATDGCAEQDPVEGEPAPSREVRFIPASALATSGDGAPSATTSPIEKERDKDASPAEAVATPATSDLATAVPSSASAAAPVAEGLLEPAQLEKRLADLATPAAGLPPAPLDGRSAELVARRSESDGYHALQQQLGQLAQQLSRIERWQTAQQQQLLSRQTAQQQQLAQVAASLRRLEEASRQTAQREAAARGGRAAPPAKMTDAQRSRADSKRAEALEKRAKSQGQQPPQQGAPHPHPPPAELPAASALPPLAPPARPSTAAAPPPCAPSSASATPHLATSHHPHVTAPAASASAPIGAPACAPACAVPRACACAAPVDAGGLTREQRERGASNYEAAMRRKREREAQLGGLPADASLAIDELMGDGAAARRGGPGSQQPGHACGGCGCPSHSLCTVPTFLSSSGWSSAPSRRAFKAPREALVL